MCGSLIIQRQIRVIHSTMALYALPLGTWRPTSETHDIPFVWRRYNAAYDHGHNRRKQ
jgi:hypothetical protein